MTIQEIRELKAQLREVYETLPERHQREMQNARLTLMKLQQKCNHKNPDDSSAIDKSVCKLCQQKVSFHENAKLTLRLSDDSLQ